MMFFLDRGRRPSASPAILNADAPKGPQGPWSGGGGGDGGPRNPWSVPPPGRRGAGKPTALDDFIRRARGGRGGGNFNLPNPAPRALWLTGAGLVLAAWALFTSVHPIGQGQRGVVTYLGSYGGTLEPGVRVTLPAPLASVTKVDVQNVRQEDFPENGGENLMLTRDQNIIDLAYTVRWSISSAEDYVFQIAEPRDTVRATAESAMREVVASVTLDQAIGPGRDFIAAQVQDRMQRVLDEYHSGIRVQGVGIKQADPPEAVNDAFKDVTAAQQDAQALRNNAEAYAQRKTALAQGEAAAFDAYYAQYKLSPDVTRRRMYYETMEQVLGRSDKTVVEAPGVTSYLPLDRLRRLPEPGAEASGAQAQAPAQSQGGGQ